LTAVAVVEVSHITLVAQQLLLVQAEAAEAARAVKVQAAVEALVKTVLLVLQTVVAVAVEQVLGRRLLITMVVLAAQEK
jgi:hypothetical protein